MNELQIVEYINHLGYGTILDTICVVLSYIPLLAAVWFALALIAYRYDARHGRRVFLSMLIAVLIYFIVNDFFFKTIFVDLFTIRLRPYLVDSNIIAIGKPFIDSSFPSGHVASTVAVLGVLFHFYKKYWLPIVIFILFMSFARIHQGMHYPSDVLAGLILGILYSASGIWVAKKILSRRKP
jgi:undecaprenyl-diphosphatase